MQIVMVLIKIIINNSNNNCNDSNTLFDGQVGKWQPSAELWTYYYTNSNRIG